jgi:hypothetical protein
VRLSPCSRLPTAWTVCSPERAAPSNTTDRVCRSYSVPPSVTGLERLSGISIPATGTANSVVHTFVARSNFAINRRLDVTLSGPDATAFRVRREFDGASHNYTISVLLASENELKADILSFTVTISDAQPECFTAASLQTGPCSATQSFVLSVGRAICPPSQYFVLSRRQLAVTVNFGAPVPRNIPGVDQTTPYYLSAVSNVFGPGRSRVRKERGKGRGRATIATDFNFASPPLNR